MKQTQTASTVFYLLMEKLWFVSGFRTSDLQVLKDVKLRHRNKRLEPGCSGVNRIQTKVTFRKLRQT